MRGQGEARQGGRPSLGVEGGSGVRSEPAPDRVWACGLQAACRLQEPARQVLGACTIAGAAPLRCCLPGVPQAALPPYPGLPGPAGGPQGVSLLPTGPPRPSTCPRPTCPLLGTLGSGTSLSPSCSRDQPLLGGTGHGGQARWVAAHCPGFGVSCSRPDLASDAPRGPLMLACPWRGPAALISTSITMLALSARLVKGLILSLLREPCEGW